MNEKFRGITGYFSKVIKGVLGTQITVIPDLVPPPRYPEDQEKPVLRYKRHGCVYRSPVIDLSQTGEGFPGTDPVDVDQLLKDVRCLALYAQPSVRKPRNR